MNITVRLLYLTLKTKSKIVQTVEFDSEDCFGFRGDYGNGILYYLGVIWKK